MALRHHLGTRVDASAYSLVQAWERICNASRKEFQAIYDRLGVVLQERGESYYNSMLKDVVDSLMEQGVAVESDGAKCVFIEVRCHCDSIDEDLNQ